MSVEFILEFNVHWSCTVQPQAQEKVRRSPLPLSYSNEMFEAVCIAPFMEDLSLSQLQVVNGIPQNEIFANRMLGLIREHTSAEKLYAINAAVPTARVALPSVFTNEIHLNHHFRLYTNTDYPVEGVWLSEPHDSMGINTKGCPIVVITAGPFCIPVHAGRDAMVDRERIMTGKKSREHESVIYAVIESLRLLGVSPSEIHLQGFFGLDPQSFDHPLDHPVFGEVNQRMETELNRRGRKILKKYADGKHKFVLGELLFLQATECGIPINQITYTHKLPVSGHFAAHSKHERSNLVIITRKAA